MYKDCFLEIRMNFAAMKNANEYESGETLSVTLWNTKAYPLAETSISKLRFRRIVSMAECLRSRMYKFYEGNIYHVNKFITNHFFAENIPKWTTYDIIQHYYKGFPVKRQRESVWKVSKFTKRKLQQLKRLFGKNDL